MKVTYNPHRKQFEDIVLPPEGAQWGGMNRYDVLSRWNINDLEWDDLINWIPLQNTYRQMPAQGAPIAKLISPVIWMQVLPLNQSTFIYALCVNGHIYQVSSGGAVIDIGGGFSVNSDLASWQGSNIIFSDLNQNKIFNWNGSTLATVFTAQPARFLAVFGGRLWMANNNVVVFTNAGTFNSLGGDSGAFVIGDEDTGSSILAMQPFLGQLYVFGPDWIQSIGNLQDTGTPAVLLFNRYTIENQLGPINKWSIIERGSYIYFANSYGFWVLQGLDPVEVAPNLDGFFQTVDLHASSFSAAFGQIYGVPCLMWQAKVQSEANGSAFIMADQKWCRWNSTPLTFITDAIDGDTGLQTVWGTDTSGTIFKLFTNPSANVTSRMQSKIYDFGHPIEKKTGIWLGVTAVHPGSAQITMEIIDENLKSWKTKTKSVNLPAQFINATGQLWNFINATNQPAIFSSQNANWNLFQMIIPIQFRGIGLNYTVVGTGSVFSKLVWQIKPVAAAFGT